MTDSSRTVVSFVDSHVHLADAAFVNDVDAVITRARAAGARALVCIGESPGAAARARNLAALNPTFVFHTSGVHPHDAAQWDDQRHPAAIHEAIALGAVAVGECGLDYYYDNAPREQQRRVLTAQLDLAATARKPMVLHTRDAEDDTRAFLADAALAGVTGVLHCFTGTTALAEAGLAAGWYVSFSGIITFRKWTDVGVLKAIPADRLLVESDAPYLAPVPFRGKRNEPAWVAHTLAHLATVREVPLELLAEQTIANTCTLFDISTEATSLPEQHRST